MRWAQEIPDWYRSLTFGKSPGWRNGAGNTRTAEGHDLPDNGWNSLYYALEGKARRSRRKWPREQMVAGTFDQLQGTPE
ncbi:MAG: hypothetical protein OXC72_01360 [Roseovarius sp.]|nr:hypothetical protein [Roseovarius sp.]MCY4290394.1 hypothetical protein [Roseovarius sp.]